jgi:hypothetical protein
MMATAHAERTSMSKPLSRGEREGFEGDVSKHLSGIDAVVVPYNDFEAGRHSIARGLYASSPEHGVRQFIPLHLLVRLLNDALFATRASLPQRREETLCFKPVG